MYSPKSESSVGMFRKLKEMLKKDEQPPVTISCDEIPEWIGREGSIVAKSEEERISGSRKPVLDAIRTIRELITGLGSGAHAELGFPKLEKVAENSLPIYKKAVISAVTRQFPDKPEEFYFAVAETLKGCIKSSSGPGRYLVRVFPEEMKGIRSAIDQIGKEVNLMNLVIAESRKKRDELEKIRGLHKSLIRVINEYAEAEKNYSEILGRIKVLSEEMVLLADQITRLGNDPRMKMFTGLTLAEQGLIDERKRTIAEIGSISGIIIHVMRRAEKIAQKDRKEPVVKKMHVIVDLLSKNEIPPQDEFLPLLSEVLPHVTGMVTAGEIALRNKEEEHYFHNPLRLPSRIRELYHTFDRINLDIGAVRRKIEGDAFIREKESLETRYKLKKTELNEKERTATDLKKRIESTSGEAPALIRQIEEKINRFSAMKVVITSP
jgi:hypothetical protein